MSGTTSQATEHSANQSDSPPGDARAILRVDLAALRGNFRILKSAAAPAECAAVVKADAYGLGIAPVAAALATEGCSTFFVASLGEAKRLRSLQASIDIFVLDGLINGCAADYAAHALRPVLGSLAEIAEWSAYCASIGKKLAAALHIDTGMSRLGLPSDEAAALFQDTSALNTFELVLIMSHLACADTLGDPKTEAQRAAFDAACARLPDAPRSLANSAGTLGGSSLHYDLVRPGIALFGGRAINDSPNPMAPVAYVSARVLQVRNVAPGETVGYGATYRVTQPSRIATVALGYADGYLRSIVGGPGPPNPCISIAGQRVPIVGRVSMDMTALDVTEVPEDLVARGEFVEMMGADLSVDDLADHAGTIGYEILTRLGSRLHRHYVTD